MPKDLIKTIRTEVAKLICEAPKIENIEEVSYSPDKKYFFKATFYELKASTHSHTATRIELFESVSGKKIFEFNRNDDTTFHCWLLIENKHYLLLSEDIEGKSIFDFYNEKFLSYSMEDDKFIWTEYYPSPDNSKLAIIGCYWACPYIVRVYDISNPMVMPYKELYTSTIDIKTIKWINNQTLQCIYPNNECHSVTFSNA